MTTETAPPRRRHATAVVVLAAVLALDTVLPWFSRTTILPAGDGHLEVLNAWMSGWAVAPVGSGPLGPLRAVPWGLLLLAVAVAGIAGGVLARRTPGHRAAARTCVVAAAAGLVCTVLSWMAAAAGTDTDTLPHVGVIVALALLAAWLLAATALLRAAR
ncbi:hypothetical protein [Spirilliplanes yamanashiensis]|uniref:hypothetical protein n=1 Tax=Spirilliplanes yamanashiensis TaxID=42233 RepID=UPI001950E5B2|nr:hypothetical protein [Spirilliplanes yamanashiensis]MDP9816736.1 hypothetical protein [Spirilliplanes yamanashiensis]